MVWAFIAPMSGTCIQLKDVMKHCRSELVNYMVPDQITFIDEIPKKAGAGKVDFDKMIQLANEEIASLNGGINGQVNNVG
jgi:non-ribosomal peptide synthetase component E (peptide arylation enzyme)